jgi:hypothetical protein
MRAESIGDSTALELSSEAQWKGVRVERHASFIELPIIPWVKAP